MTIQYNYIPDDQFLLVKISGVLEWEQLQDAAEKVTTSNEFSAHVDTLYDLSEMDFTNITTEFEEKLILFRKHLDRGDAKIACVVSSDVGFGMGRMYEILSDKLPQQVRVFKKMEDAKDWIKTK
jgi:hypothetical protein